MIERIPSIRIFSAALIFSLAACGGGDDTGSSNASTVPTEATSSIGNDETSAKSIVNLLVSTDDQAVASDSSFNQINGLTKTVGFASGAINPTRAAKQIQETVNCSEYYPVGQPVGNGQVTGCNGNISVISNLDELQTGNDQTLLPVGAYFTISFDQVSVQTSDGGSFSLGGSLTMTVLESSQRGGSNGFVGGFQISVTNLTGVDSNGETFGPETSTIVVTFEADGRITYVVDGVRVTDFEITETADEDSYTINSGTIMTDYDGGHAEVSFQNWAVVDGIPQVGASVTVTGANGTATILVQSIDNDTITFRVAITVNGVEEIHIVEASISGNQVVVTT
jgi:hypothetical protein